MLTDLVPAILSALVLGLLLLCGAVAWKLAAIWVRQKLAVRQARRRA
ncbi:hypothetical protein [Leifsonia sp. NPDC058248]